MKKHIITLGGLPGSGKSTVRDIVAQKLGYTTFYTGGYSRKLAEKRGLTLEEWNDLVATDKSLDELIDVEQRRIEAEDDEYVVDAHLGYHFVPSSFKVFLTVSVEEGCRRIFNDNKSETRIKSGDTMQTLEEAIERTQKRIANHKERYKRHYGIDPYDESQYDLVIDTNTIPPEKVAEIVLEGYNTWVTT